MLTCIFSESVMGQCIYQCRPVFPVKLVGQYIMCIVSVDQYLQCSISVVLYFQGICDGAGCVIIASGDAVNKYNLKPLSRLVAYGVSGM